MTDLSQFDNSWYSPGRSRLVQILWFFCGAPIVRSALLPFSGVRRSLLQAFGARIGAGVVIKPGVRVKYPWRLAVGDHSWLGEDCWIDNLADVSIGANACISQGAYLCTGNHNWSDRTFGLIVHPITIGAGAWVGARTTVCPGVTLHEESVASAGSVVAHDIGAYEIHLGNPAKFVKTRRFDKNANSSKETPLHYSVRA
jgi:putative colanic acid biosynthesis acetyltransferase WcaF